MKHTYIFILLAFVGSLYAKAQQNAVVFGVIADSATTEPMNMVNIYTSNTTKRVGVVTDKHGKFTISIPANVNVDVIFSYSGYKKIIKTFHLRNGERQEVRISLAPERINLPQTTIKSDTYRNEGITKINPDWAKTSAGPTNGIENVIKSLGEGTSSNNELSSQYSVRGGNYDENLVYVNDIEIFRPFLIRSAQQEGLSFVNTDMVSDVSFSSGGFDAKYGDKMSSVLDIKYRKPQTFAGSVSAGLMGGSAHLEGVIGKKMTFQIGYRNKNVERLLTTGNDSGSYKPLFNDVQLYLTYDFNPKTTLAFLGNYASNRYSFIPVYKDTKFGSISEMYKLYVYFEGQEKDVFNSMFGSLVLSHHPNERLALKFITSAFSTDESENYDIQGEYWLNDISAGEDLAVEKGIGKYIEHARNRLQARIFNAEHKGTLLFADGNLQWSMKAQYELINDRQNEWKLVDSSGYSIPQPPIIIGQPNPPQSPLLQNIYKSNNDLSSYRFAAYIQREWKFFLPHTLMFLNTGVRSSAWTFNNEVLVSPRASISFKPYWKQDIVFRFAAGIYQQSPFYREYRGFDGSINENILSQKSVHAVFSTDWNFKMMGRPFRFLGSIYYKYLWDLIPYTLDNVRIRYSAQNNAVGYAQGIDLRLFGQFIRGIDSWITMSVMQTRENIDGDGAGYIPRPTDQLFNMNISFQDYLPRMPFIRIYLNFNFGTGYPYGPPDAPMHYRTSRMPSYMRADIAFTFRIKDENASWAKNNFLKVIKRIWLNIEWFNVFSNQNVISYTWVSALNNRSYAVPNYLTPSTLNARLSLEF